MNPDNNGNIGIRLYNYDNEKPVEIKKGDRIAQGIIVKYDNTVNQEATKVWEGGFGSTGE